MDTSWKDGMGNPSDDNMTLVPDQGDGNGSVSVSSVLNKGLDRTLVVEAVSSKGIRKSLTVNQTGCREAYVTTDGGRYVTADGQVYGVLKADAPCQCTDSCLISYVRPDGGITSTPSRDCIGIVLNSQGHRFMIEKNEDSNESYETAASGKSSTFKFYWGGYRTDQPDITNYDTADGSNVYGYLKPESGSYDSTPNFSANVSSWTSGALSDWKGKDNSNVLKGVTTGGGSFTTYAAIGHVLNTFLASPDAKGFDDWYIPSLPQLSLIFMHLTSVNNALSAIGGQQYTSNYYWSSSENSSYDGWCVTFSNGGVGYSSKNNSYRVRFIRDI